MKKSKKKKRQTNKKNKKGEDTPIIVISEARRLSAGHWTLLSADEGQ